MCVCEKNLCVTLFFPRQCWMRFEPESETRVTVKGETDCPKRMHDLNAYATQSAFFLIKQQMVGFLYFFFCISSQFYFTRAIAQSKLYTSTC